MAQNLRSKAQTILNRIEKVASQADALAKEIGQLPLSPDNAANQHRAETLASDLRAAAKRAQGEK